MALTEYTFKTVWHIEAPLAKAHVAIEDVHSWKRWWPGLANVIADTPSSGLVGSQATMTWRAVLGYKLHIQIAITSYAERSDITFISNGDLVGEGSWLFDDNERNTVMTINWHVRTTKPWMNVLAPVLRPIFTMSHYKLMRKGERGLNEYLRSTLPVDRLYS